MAVVQQNNRRMMMNLMLSRAALAEVVQELVQAPPTEDELRLLTQVAEEAQEQELELGQIENRLRDTRLWQLLAVLARNDVRVLAYLTLLIMIFQTYLMVRPPPQATPHAPQITVNVTVDADEIAEKVAKRLEDDGICVAVERTAEGKKKPRE